MSILISLCASDDRYADDAHYMGGCLLNENLTWGCVLLTFAALPPDPAIVGERWRTTWLERLDGAVLFPEQEAIRPVSGLAISSTSIPRPPTTAISTR